MATNNNPANMSYTAEARPKFGRKVCGTDGISQSQSNQDRPAMHRLQ